MGTASLVGCPETPSEGDQCQHRVLDRCHPSSLASVCAILGAQTKWIQVRSGSARHVKSQLVPTSLMIMDVLSAFSAAPVFY